jgi:transcriptional antiterminator NusG
LQKERRIVTPSHGKKKRVSNAPEEIAPDEKLDFTLREVPQDGIPRRWYALHTMVGQEISVQKRLLATAPEKGLGDLVTNAIVPIERVTEVRGGEKRVSRRKSFPGYVLIQLPENPKNYPELWQFIHETPGVTGFVGARGGKPSPLSEQEVQAIIAVARGEVERPRPKVAVQPGDRVKITDGAFANFIGNVGEIYPERGTLQVIVEIFERQTPLEVEFWQIEPL